MKKKEMIKELKKMRKQLTKQSKEITFLLDLLMEYDIEMFKDIEKRYKNLDPSLDYIKEDYINKSYMKNAVPEGIGIEEEQDFWGYGGK